MIIKVPNNNIKERTYIIDIIFSEILAVNYTIEIEDITDYEIIVGKKKIIIKDYFFSKFTDNQYLSIKNIPTDIKFLSNNKLIIKDNLPIIFGNPKIEQSTNKTICEIDIFASSFFMLSRWEEFVIKEKDKNGRFPDEKSLAFKFNFHKRAVVNEYIDLLWTILLQSGLTQKRKERDYNLFLTHDIDFFRRYNSTKKVIKALGGDLLKRKNPKMAKKTLSAYNKIKKGQENDPYDTFGFLMDISDKHGVKSHFYFIPEIIGEADAQYNINDIEVIETIDRIKQKNHIVGAHFGWETFNDEKILKVEQNRLADITKKFNESRQHYLRFENPTTWQILDKNNIEIDSTLGYNSDIGFRCGVCYPFSVFDIVERKKLKLKEYPLLVMDTALANKTKNKEKFIAEITNIYNTVKLFSGTFVFLWHQNNQALPEWEFVSKEYENIISIIKS